MPSDPEEIQDDSVDRQESLRLSGGLVNSSPEIMSLTLDGYEQFIHVPDVAQATLPPLEPTGVLRVEFEAPLPDGLVGDDDPALRQKILDLPKAQAKAMIEPDGVADDLGRKAVSAVAGRIVVHLASLPGPGSS